jgi:hypothetical protein
VAGIDERVEESKNWFERIAERIPLYNGYKQKELRREADKTERLYAAGLLDSMVGKLDGLKADVLNRGDLDTLGVIDVVIRKIRKVADRVRFADYGYAGLFDPAKVREPELDQLRQFDREFGAGIGELMPLLEALKADSPSLRSDLGLLEEKVEALDARFSDRENLITGAGR